MRITRWLLFCVSLAYSLICSPASAQRRQVDIGAAEAPLSDQERTDLDAAVRKHNYAAEKAVIDRARAENPMSRELLIMAGRLAYLERQPKDAVEALTGADKITPLDDDDLLTLAIAEQSTGMTGSARAAFAKLIQAHPKDAEYLYMMGRLQRESGQVEESAATFRKTIELDPKLLHAYEDLGLAQEALGLNDDARKTYEAGLTQERAMHARWEPLPVDLGALLLKSDEFDAAAKLFHEALSYSPQYGWAYYYLAQTEQKQNKEEDALRDYKLAVIHQPTLRQAWLALGRLYTRRGQKDDAEKCLARFKELEALDNARKEELKQAVSTPAAK